MINVQILKKDDSVVSGVIGCRFGSLSVVKYDEGDADGFLTLGQANLYKVGSLVLFRDEAKALRGLLSSLLEDMG